MSYNGSGTFNINTSGQPVVTGTVISSTAFNALTADLGTGLSTAITKNGQTTVTANIPFNGYKLTGIAVATASGDALSYGQAATVSALTDSALTSGRVPYASTAGLFVDSANLTFNGTTLTANTIGAFTLGGTVAGGGNNIKNVIIGATTPLAGTFTTLTSTGVANFQNVSATIGNSSGQGNNGAKLIFNGWNTAGTNWQIDTAVLSSANQLAFTPSTVAGGLTFTTPVVLVSTTGLAVTGALSNTTGANFATSSGSVGIGTSSPAALLDVNGFMRSIALGTPPASGAGLELFYTSSTGYVQAYNRGTSAYNALFLSGSTVSTLIGGSTAMIVDASANLGIGTTNPSGGTSSSTNIKLAIGGASGGLAFNASNAAGRIESINGNGTLTYAVGTTSGAAHSWVVGSSTTAMTLDGSGNLLVGRTTTANTTVGAGIYSSGIIASCQSASTNANTAYDLYSTGASAYRFYVGMGGTIYATSIVITAISDERLKENVRDIDTGLSSIMALKPRRFDWKEGKGQDKKNVAGFIAQEFEDVFPECVSTSKAGEDGIEYKNINHETLIPTLVKAIQELKAEFDAYKASHP